MLLQSIINCKRAVRARDRTNALLGFLVRGVLAAVPAELGQLETVFNRLFILARKVVDAPALFALHIDEIVLAHGEETS